VTVSGSDPHAAPLPVPTAPVEPAGDADTDRPRPYRQVARAQRQARTREALMGVALEEFTRGCWERVSLSALATRAHVTKQTLLRHFGSKEGLLMQALASGAADMFEQRWSTPPGDVEAAVENVLDHYEAWGERSLRIGAWLEGGNPALAGISRMARKVHYDWVGYAFAPQLERCGDEERARVRAALIALCDLHTWWLLSHDLGMERAAVSGVLTTAIERLLGERPR
jgi:AcrR family transcriptional regulator